MIEHKCTSRECGKITTYEEDYPAPANCVECGRAVLETWYADQNPVRQAKQGLLARARALFDKKVDRELDEVFNSGAPRDIDEEVLAALQGRECDPAVAAAVESAFSRQEGGGHYKDFEIQPAEFIHKNGIGFLAGNVIKYVCRHGAKNGAQDLRKAIHYIELLLESEYGERRGND